VNVVRCLSGEGELGDEGRYLNKEKDFNSQIIIDSRDLQLQ